MSDFEISTTLNFDVNATKPEEETVPEDLPISHPSHMNGVAYVSLRRRSRHTILCR